MDDGTFASFIDAISDEYEQKDRVTVVHDDDGVGDTVRLIVVGDTVDEAKSLAESVKEDIASLYNGRTRISTVYGPDERERRAVEVLAVPEHETE